MQCGVRVLWKGLAYVQLRSSTVRPLSCARRSSERRNAPASPRFLYASFAEGGGGRASARSCAQSQMMSIVCSWRFPNLPPLPAPLRSEVCLARVTATDK
jgi:hypothetical protein